MRYPKGLEVLLLKPNSTETYAEVEHGSCKFAIGEAGKPFWVLVQVPQQAFSYADTISVQLYVEGQRPGYTFTLHRARTCCTFKGYGSVLDGQQRYKHFQFAEPSSAAHAAAPAPAAEAGQLRVKFTHVVERSRQRGAGSLSATPFPTAHQHDEDKKWYEQPSLSVRPGAFSDTFTLVHVAQETVAELAQCILHLETATVLHLRKVLQASNPAHQRILEAAGLLPITTSLPIASKFSVPSTNQKLGVKRNLFSPDVNTRTVIDLSGMASTSNTSGKELECIDLTQP